jgi:hypothetical protein
MGHDTSNGIASDANPRLTVIVPFDDPRGSVEFLRSWTQLQTCPDDWFEVVALTDGSDPAMDGRIRSVLRPQDRLVHGERNCRFWLYDVGGRAARGRFVLLTEDHCVADRRCVAAVLEHADTHRTTAAFLRSGHINRTPLARMENLLYEEVLRTWWLRAGYWDKVRIRGFVIDRDTYYAAGGLDGNYGHFAETMLSARLHALGVRVEYAEAAVVHHVNTPTFGHMAGEIRSYVVGECAYRERHEDDLSERLVPPPVEWTQRQARTARAALRSAWAIGRTLAALRPWRRGERGGARPLLGELLRELPAALITPKVRARLALWRTMSARVRFHFAAWSEPRRLSAARDYWNGVVHQTRLAYIAAHPAGPETPPPPADCAAHSVEYPVGPMPARDLRGFHGTETHNGREFRWSAPVATLHLRLPPGDYDVTIDTGSIRGTALPFPLGLFLNGRKIPRRSVRACDGRVTFAVSKTMFRPGGRQALTIVCSPLVPSRQGSADSRRLGLPVCSVRFQVREAATAAAPALAALPVPGRLSA